MTYESAIEFLFGLELFGIKLGLQNITGFLDRIDNPQRHFKAVHVAGTNGKGSTASMIESMLMAGGYRVGKFTSPHLVDYRERFRLDGSKVDREFVADFVTDHHQYIRDERITFFETATALAFKLFKDAKVDVGIIEVGLGGRLDATNVLDPEVSVITQVAFDHINILGQTLDKIGLEKAGIIKPGVPVVTTATDPGALGSIVQIASERNAAATCLVCDRDYAVTQIDESGTQFKFANREGEERSLMTNMVGRHMAENAALAVAAVDVMRGRGLKLSEDAISSGLRNVYWPARFQIIDGYPRVIFDAAHNPHGMEALADTLLGVYPNCRVRTVLGTLQRPDLDLLFDEVSRFTAHAVLCIPKAERAGTMEEMVRCAIEHRIAFTVVHDAGEAFDRAVSDADAEERVVVTGSHHTVGEVFERLGIEP